MKIIVEGMRCIHCVNRIKNALESVGAKKVVVDLDEKSVSFDAISQELAVQEIEDLGFEVKV